MVARTCWHCHTYSNMSLPDIGSKNPYTGQMYDNLYNCTFPKPEDLENDEKEIREYQAEDLKFKPRKRKTKVSKDEMKKLAALEKHEGASKLDGN